MSEQNLFESIDNPEHEYIGNFSEWKNSAGENPEHEYFQNIEENKNKKDSKERKGCAGENYVFPRSAFLSDQEILEEIELGNIIINPFNRNALGVNSYDVCLGSNFYVPRYDVSQNGIYRQHASDGQLAFLDPTSQKDINEYWKLKSLNEDDSLMLYPRTLILGHTNEFIGTKAGSRLVPIIADKSTSARVGLTICNCSFMGNQGYFNRYTMELTNGLNIPLKLYPNLSVAQVAFVRTGESIKKYDSQYQQSGLTLEELQKNWNPTQMLPKPLQGKT